MLKKISKENVLLQKVSESRSYLMMLVSSLMEIQKVEKELSTSSSIDLNQAINDLSMLDELLEQSQEELV